MPTARRDRYEWEYVVTSIEMASDDPDNDLGLERINPDVLSAIRSKIEVALDSHQHTGEWTRIPIVLTEAERAIVNRRLVPLSMLRVAYSLERWDLLGLHAVDEEYAELQDRVLYITTHSPKYSDDLLSLWISHGDSEWLKNWIDGCTTPEGELR